MNENKGKLYSNSVEREAVVSGALKECLKFMVKSWILILCIYFSENGVPRILYLLLAKGILKNLLFVSFDGKQVTDKYCLIGTSDWFAIDVSFLIYHVDLDYNHLKLESSS